MAAEPADMHLSVDDWDVGAHPRLVVLDLHHEGGRVAAAVSPGRAVAMAIRLIQAAYVADSAVCTRPGAESALDRIDEVLAGVR